MCGRTWVGGCCADKVEVVEAVVVLALAVWPAVLLGSDAVGVRDVSVGKVSVGGCPSRLEGCPAWDGIVECFDWE